MVHSFLYYHLDTNLVSDDTWQKWADELTELQKECKIIGFYDTEFADWDGTTGNHLPIDDWVQQKAYRLLKSKDILDSKLNPLRYK